MLRKQIVAIYRNRRTGALRIQPYARAGAGSQPCGQQTLLPSDVGDGDLLRAILENMAKNDRQSYSLSMAPSFSPEERRRIIREDQLIHIEEEGNTYRLIPFRKMRNSFGSIDDMTQFMSSDDFQRHGSGALRKLFLQIP